MPAGTMTAGEHRDPELRLLRFGFDLEHLFLRLDLSGPAASRLVQGLSCTVSFTIPAGHRLVVRGTKEGPRADLQVRRADGGWSTDTAARPRVAVGDIIELAIPFAALRLRPNSPFAFFVTIVTDTVELERHPIHRPVESIVPEPTFEELNWNA